MNPPPLHIEPENTNPFENWFFETHGGTDNASWELEEDSDECLEDCYEDKDE